MSVISTDGNRGLGCSGSGEAPYRRLSGNRRGVPPLARCFGAQCGRKLDSYGRNQHFNTRSKLPNLSPERYAPLRGLETPPTRNVIERFDDALTHAVGEPVTYVQVSPEAKGHRDRRRRFSNSPITKGKRCHPEGANLRHWLGGKSVSTICSLAIKRFTQIATVLMSVHQACSQELPASSASMETHDACAWMKAGPLRLTNLPALYKAIIKDAHVKLDSLGIDIETSDFARSRYETEQQFGARQESLEKKIGALSLLGPHSTVIFSRDLDRLAARNLGKYDPVRAALIITASDIYGYFYDDKDSAGTFKSIEHNRKAYMGENAFGARRVVHASTTDFYGVVWKVSEVTDASVAGSYPADEEQIEIAIPPGIAQRETQNIEFVGAGVPVAPFVAYSRSDVAPSIEAPFDRIDLTHGIQIATPCIAVRNKVTHTIYGVLHLPPWRRHP